MKENMELVILDWNILLSHNVVKIQLKNILSKPWFSLLKLKSRLKNIIIIKKYVVMDDYHTRKIHEWKWIRNNLEDNYQSLFWKNQSHYAYREKKPTNHKSGNYPSLDFSWIFFPYAIQKEWWKYHTKILLSWSLWSHKHWIQDHIWYRPFQR